MRIGLTELVLIAILVLAFFSPEKLKEYSKAAGKALRSFREEKDKIEKELVDPIMKETESIKEPIDEIIQPIKEAKELMQFDIEQGGKK